MRISLTVKIVSCVIAIAGADCFGMDDTDKATNSRSVTSTAVDTTTVDVIRDDNIQLCQGFDTPYGGQVNGCSGTCPGGCDSCAPVTSGLGYAHPAIHQPTQTIRGVNQHTPHRRGREAKWRQSADVPWESLAYGEYIGPHRTPHVTEYRLRVDDLLEFVYLRTRNQTAEAYRLYVGDTIQISSAIDASLTETDLVVRSDGMVSLKLIGQVRVAGKTIENLQSELDEKYSKFVKNPGIVVQVSVGDTPLEDLIASVDARQGQGGQSRQATVAPDGTIQLPGIGSVPAVGLTLKEIGREVKARYRLRQGGIEVTPILLQRAQRFIYVSGSVNQGGRFELTGPTTAIQALALAQGITIGANARQIVVLRRDQDWRLTATKIDLNGALLGKQPYPSDEIWLRDSDIVLVPPKPIQRLSEAVDLYFTRTLYSLFPVELGSFDAGSAIN